MLYVLLSILMSIGSLNLSQTNVEVNKGFNKESQTISHDNVYLTPEADMDNF